MVFSVNIDECNFLLSVDGVAGQKINNNINKSLRILKNIGDNMVKKLGFIGNRIGEIITEDTSEEFRNCCVFLD